MFVVLTYTSDFIVYFVRALLGALSKKNYLLDFTICMKYMTITIVLCVCVSLV